MDNDNQDGKYSKGCSPTTLNKTRLKSISIREYVYDVEDELCSCISFKDVSEISGAKVHIKSSVRGMTTVGIRGTRGQIQAALRIITTSTGEKEKELEKAQAHWFDWVQQAFPDLEQRAYFLPPVYITRVPISKKTIAGQSVVRLRTEDAQGNNMKESVATSSARPLHPSSNTPSVQKSDVIYGKALQCVLYSLRRLSKEHNEVFMCLSQFPFGSYLGEPRFAPAVAHLPVSSNLSSAWQWKWRQGDFDILLIHKDYGCIILKIKAVSETHEEQQTERMAKVLKEATKQLEKEEVMLSHLLSDIASGVRITTTIACPNLTAQQIENVISANQELRQDLMKFSSKYPADVASMFLCSDQLCSPEMPKRVRDSKIKAFKQWWKDSISVSGPDTQLNINLYRSLIARFCGPASTVTVSCINEPRVCIKTLDQAVATVGKCYTAHVTLFPEQIELLSRAPSKVFISGPPGTGKSTALLQMGTHWMQEGRQVCILSTWDRSLAATFRLRHLLEEIRKQDCTSLITEGCVIFIRKNFRKKQEVDETLTELVEIACQGPLSVIADEVGPVFESENYIFPDFCANLLDRCRSRGCDLHFWASSCYDNVAPEDLYDGGSEGWELVHFTRSLRSPPSVLREIRLAVEITKDRTVRDYTDRGLPDHSDGPPVNWFQHHVQQYGCTRVEDCVVCGGEVARFLCTELRIGLSTSCMGSNSKPHNTDGSLASSKSTPSLRYKDVLILSWTQLREDAPVLRALSSYNVPVCVMKDSDIEDVATARSDVVWAARHHLIFGLMRKIVVVLNNYDDSKGKYISIRLRAMSRCSSQLVVVCPPPECEPD